MKYNSTSLKSELWKINNIIIPAKRLMIMDLAVLIDRKYIVFENEEKNTNK